MTSPIPPDEVLKAVAGVDRIDKVLSGGQKHVYRCAINGETYALKVVPLPQGTGQGVDDPVALAARVEREFATLNACDTPYLVRLGPLPLAPAMIGGQDALYYTEEWIEGRDLGEMLSQDGPLPIDEIVRVARHVTTAIDCIRRQNKVHRDIKPGNIIRRHTTGDFVLLDLGYALDRYDVSLTVAGGIPGTFPYFSPEQCDASMKRKLDFRSDLFALGVSLYEVATGTHPFYRSGMSAQQTMACIVSANPPPPSTLRADLPVGLEQTILKLMQKQPYMRYTACAKVLKALESAAPSSKA